MPVTPTYPGVYIEEVPSGVRTITGVATSIAAFLGRTSKGRVNKAVRLLSWADYERRFGAPHPKSDLAQSVRLFFDNGGTDCYVVRLALNAKSASVGLANLNSELVLQVTAKAEGIWGNTVRLEVDYNTLTPDETFNLRVIYEEGGTGVQSESFSGLTMDPDAPRFAPSFVSNSSDLVTLTLDPTVDLSNSFSGFSQSRRPLASMQSTLDGLLNPAAPATPQSCFEISVDGSPYVPVDIGTWSKEEITAASLGEIATRFQDRINAALDAVSAIANVAVTFASPPGLDNLLTIASNGATSTQASVRIRRATSRDISVALMLGTDQGGIEPARYSNFRPAPTASILRIGNPATLGSLDTLDQITALQEDAITSITINTEVITLDIQTTDTATNLWHKSKPGYSPATGENDGVREKLRIIVNAINDNPNLSYRAELWGYTLAIIATDDTFNAKPVSIATAPHILNTNSEFIVNTRQYTLGTGGSSDFNRGPDGNNTGIDGDDGMAPDAATYQGSAAQQTGFHALDPVDLFNLMILPGDEEVPETTMQDLWSPASVYCQSRRAFLLIDPPASWTDNNGRPKVVQDTLLIKDLQVRLGDLTDHAAAFYPPLRITSNGTSRVIAPAGAMAGLMARTDATRGVWKAPAGIEAGIRSIIGVTVELTDAENGVLNKKGVNCIRVFPNGIVNWGARTLKGDDDFGSEWKYIPIRRLALFLEESLYRGTRWAVFEPNDEPLWANIRMNIGAFMFSLFRQGAFQGTSPREAFYVKCDKETTTQDDRNKGIVNIEVGFAPLKPAEFVIIKIQQMAGEL